MPYYLKTSRYSVLLKLLLLNVYRDPNPPSPDRQQRGGQTNTHIQVL